LFTVLKRTQSHDICRCFSCNKTNMRVKPHGESFLFKCFDCGIGGDHVGYQMLKNKINSQFVAKAAKAAKVLKLFQAPR